MHVDVNADRRCAKSQPKDEVGRFSTHSREIGKPLYGRGDLAVVFLGDDRGDTKEVARFVMVEPGRVDERLDLFA